MDFDKPLAYRMRPRTLEEYVGQEHILGKDKILYRRRQEYTERKRRNAWS